MWIPDRNDKLTDLKPLCIPELGRGQVVCSEAEHCQIREGVDARDREVEIATIGK
jgi:hypothetical protein